MYTASMLACNMQCVVCIWPLLANQGIVWSSWGESERALHHWFHILSWHTDHACTVRNRVCQPGQLRRHGLSFTLKSWPESLLCRSIICGRTINETTSPPQNRPRYYIKSPRHTWNDLCQLPCVISTVCDWAAGNSLPSRSEAYFVVQHAAIFVPNILQPSHSHLWD